MITVISVLLFISVLHLLDAPNNSMQWSCCWGLKVHQGPNKSEDFQHSTEQYVTEVKCVCGYTYYIVVQDRNI